MLCLFYLLCLVLDFLGSISYSLEKIFVEKIVLYLCLGV